MSSSKRETVPIGVGSISDPFYRYKMEAVHCQHKHRGSKTAILNMEKIAKDLNRSPEEVIKYLGHALSSSGSYSSKSREYLVNGSHSDQIVQDKLQEYCEIFVVCGLCSNPETVYKIKRDVIFLECGACGGRSEVDGSHKLCKSILAQHKLSKQANRRKRDKGKKQSKAKKEHGSETVSPSDEKAPSNGRGGKDPEDKSKKKKRVDQVDASTPIHGDYDEEFENPYFSTKGNPLYAGCFDRIAKALNRDESDAIDYAVRKVGSFMTENANATTNDVVSALTSAQEDSCAD